MSRQCCLVGQEEPNSWRVSTEDCVLERRGFFSLRYADCWPDSIRQRCEASTVRWEYSVSHRFKSYVMLNFLGFPFKKKKEIPTTYFIYPNIFTILSFQCIINAKVICEVYYILFCAKFSEPSVYFKLVAHLSLDQLLVLAWVAPSS